MRRCLSLTEAQNFLHFTYRLKPIWKEKPSVDAFDCKNYNSKVFLHYYYAIFALLCLPAFVCQLSQPFGKRRTQTPERHVLSLHLDSNARK